jgi:serine phosphatase RsbU (regulator of sigma subunit)
MDSDAQLLKEKALLLLSRERELLTLRGRYARVSAWVTVAHSLSELVSSLPTKEQVYAELGEKLMTLLQLQKVCYFAIAPGPTLQPLLAGPDGAGRPLDPPAHALLDGEGVGLCNSPDSEPLAALSRAVGLQRFLWCRLGDEMGDSTPTLMVAGYDAAKAAFYGPFEESDFGHFRSMAQTLGLELRNSALIKQLESEKRHLEELNSTLERRVAERTEEIARANRGLADTLVVLRDRDRRLQEDLEQARTFQQSILPAPPRSRRVELRSVYRPLELVGGDIYDLSELDDGHLRIFIADATGHGVQASLRTIVIKSEYDRLKDAHPSPDRVLIELNHRLTRQFNPGEMLCTACCFDLIDGSGGSTLLRYVNAAHPAVLWLSGGKVQEIYRDGPFLGLSADIELTPVEATLGPGDTLLAYTDGLCDQMNPQRKHFPLAEAAAAALRDSPPLPEALARIIDAFDLFRGASPVADDVTLIGGRLRPPT